MAYSSVENIQSEFKNLTISATTEVTTTEVTRFIEEADAYIDGVISQKYQVPITGAMSLIIVRQISIYLVAQRVKDILEVKTGSQQSEQDGRGSFKAFAEKALKDIIDDKLLLSDATLYSPEDGVASYVSSNNVPFIFERGTEQW